MAEHALLSASGSKKWIPCTRSARLEEQFLDEQSSYADEGTKCHDLMDIALRMYFFGEVPAPYPVTTVVFSAENKEVVSTEFVDLRTVDGRRKAGFTVEMDDAVEGFQKRVAEVTNRLKQDGVAFTVFIEHKVDYSSWAPEGFGTADVIIATSAKVWIFDLKYGKGVEVDANENTQMLLYGLGAWSDLSMAYDEVETLSLNIHQPRIGNFSSWEISLSDLLEWGEAVKPRAELAFAGEGDFVPGDHCESGFCRARFTCAARASACLVASAGLTPDTLISPEEIAELLPRLPDIEKWAKGLREYALKQAVDHGVRFPGYKLVEGRRGARRWSDDKEVEATMKSMRMKLEEMYDFSLISPTTADKLHKAGTIGPRQWPKLQSLITQSEGKPSVAPESDKRAALVITPVVEMFSDQTQVSDLV